MTKGALFIGGLLIAGMVLAILAVFQVWMPAASNVSIDEERRQAREKLFGSSADPRPIEKGQEMRPRW